MKSTIITIQALVIILFGLLLFLFGEKYRVAEAELVLEKQLHQNCIQALKWKRPK